MKIKAAQRFDSTHIPETSGVYLLYWGNGCVYIGRSVNMRRRVRLRNLRGKFDRAEAIPLPHVCLQAMEQSLIYRHKPRYNNRFREHKGFASCGTWYWSRGRWIPTTSSSIAWMRQDGRCIAVRKAAS